MAIKLKEAVTKKIKIQNIHFTDVKNLSLSSPNLYASTDITLFLAVFCDISLFDTYLERIGQLSDGRWIHNYSKKSFKSKEECAKDLATCAKVKFTFPPIVRYM